MNLKNMKILYVEDDLLMQEIIIEMLEDEVEELHVAENGQEGYYLYEDLKPDIVITDEIMPVLSGLDMAIKIKQKNPKQKIVLLTAFSDLTTLKKAINSDIDKLFIKPLTDFADFLAKLEDIANHISIEKDNAYKNQMLKEKDKMVDESVIYSSSDLDGNVIDISKAFLELSGYSKEEVLGRNHNIFRGQDYDKEVFKKMWKALVANQQWKGEIKNLTKDGVEYWIDVKIEPLYDESGKKIGYKSIKKDITAIKKVEFLSEHDPLTGIYNRRKIDEELKKYKNQMDRYDTECSIIITDLDKFKEVNDKYGHTIGDKILQEFSKVLKQNIRTTDIVARWGGEEFMIIAPNLNINAAYNLAEKLRKKIESHIFYNNLKITSSFGISLLKKEKDILESINEADNALYSSKKQGRNMVCKYKKST